MSVGGFGGKSLKVYGTSCNDMNSAVWWLGLILMGEGGPPGRGPGWSNGFNLLGVRDAVTWGYLECSLGSLNIIKQSLKMGGKRDYCT